MTIVRVGEALMTMETAKTFERRRALQKAARIEAIMRSHPYVIEDMGTVTYSDMPPEERAASAQRWGEHFGYPECCVAEFVQDIREGRMPGLRRGSVPLERPGGRYVPCSKCCEEMGREIAA